MFPPMKKPIREYRHITCIIVAITPPRKSHDLLSENKETAEKPPKAVPEYRTAYPSMAGFTAQIA